MVDVREYPQLDNLCWFRRKDLPMTNAEAFSLYERQWRHVDQGNLTEKENDLIKYLITTCGNGVFLV